MKSQITTQLHFLGVLYNLIMSESLDIFLKEMDHYSYA